MSAAKRENKYPEDLGDLTSRALKPVLKPALFRLSRHEQPLGLRTAWVWLDFIDITAIRGLFSPVFFILHPADVFPRKCPEDRSSSVSFEAEKRCTGEVSSDAQGRLPLPGEAGRVFIES